MKENAPKKTWFQTLRTLWVPLAIGVVTVAALAVVVGMVWKDIRMNTRQNSYFIHLFPPYIAGQSQKFS